MSSQKHAVDQLCRLLNEGDEADRCYASRALGVVRSTAAVTDLIARLTDEDIDVCVDAATALGEIGAEAAVPKLIESLQNDQSGEVCTAVTLALGKIGGEAARDTLLKVATERPEGIEWDDDWDTWWDVQLQAVKALGRFRDQQAVQPLIDILQNESQQDIEMEILLTLAQIEGAGVDFLISRLEARDSLPQHRRRTATALTRVRSKSSEISQALGRALQDEAPEVRVAAVTALAERDESRYLGALQLLLRDQDERVREAAFTAVVRLGGNLLDDENGAVMTSLLKDPGSRLRRAIFQALTTRVAEQPLTDERLQIVISNLHDNDAECATAACRLLADSGSNEALEPLLQLLDDSNAHPMVRREAALTIGRLGLLNPAVSETLKRGVCDPEESVRLAALGALTTLSQGRVSTAEKDDDPLQVVLAALRGEIGPGIELKADSDPAGDDSDVEDGEGQSAAADRAEPPPQAADLVLPEEGAEIVQAGEVEQAVSTLDAIAMDNLSAALHTEMEIETPEYDEETREYLAIVEQNRETMSRIRCKRKIDPAQDTRRLAARVLGDCGNEAGLAGLLEALNDEDEKLRCEAADSIGTIALQEKPPAALMDALGSLVTQLTIGNLDQRLACARALGRLGNQAAAAPLIEALNDPLANVRIQAIEALVQLTTQFARSGQEDHMVVRKTSSISIARKVVARLDDSEMGVRVAAARSLPMLLKQIEERSFQNQTLDKLIDSVMQWSGEEARLIGRTLRSFDRPAVIEKLLARLQLADNSLQRSVVIEMLEELLAPEMELSGQAA